MKKIIGLMLCAVLAFSSSVATFAAVKEAISVEDAISAAKAVIDVPKEYKDVESSTSSTEDGSYTSVRWSTEDGDKSISVTVDKDGYITRYDKKESAYSNYDYYYYASGDINPFPKMSREDCEKAAADFIKKIIGDYAEQVECSTYSYESFDSMHYLEYHQMVGGVAVEGNYVIVRVSDSTGEVVRYSGVSPTKFDVDTESMLADIENAMDIEKAKDTFNEKMGPELVYQGNYDYNYDTYDVIALYTNEGHKNEYLDAVTGEVIASLGASNDLAKGNSTESTSSDSTDDAAVEEEVLTPEEEEVVEEVGNTISSDKALKIIKDNFGVSTSTSTKLSTRFYKYEDVDEKYIWNISTDKFSASVDAKTGEVLYFYDDTESDNEKQGKIGVSQGKKIALEYVQKLAGSKYQQCSEIELDTRYSLYSLDYDHYYICQRVQNGIKYEDNYIRVEINSNTGNVISYRLVWYDDIDFPSVTQAISQREAFDAFVEENGFEKIFVTINDEMKLVYEPYSEYRYVDPLDGSIVNYAGEKVEEAPKEYTDIEGDENQEIIEKLLVAGFYISDSDKFEPNAIMTVRDFYKLTNPYAMESQIEDANKKLTRFELAKLLVEMMGYDEIAEKDIFVNQYDEEVPDEYMGYVAIAKALGLIDRYGDKLDGNKYVTRSEAAAVVYDVILIELEKLDEVL